MFRSGTVYKVVFFFALLISAGYNPSMAQAQQPDSLKKTNADSLNAANQPDELEETIKYLASDSVVALPQHGKAYLYGKSKVDYSTMQLESEIMETDYQKNQVTAYGKPDSTGKPAGTPVFKDGGETMEAEKIMYNLKTKKGKIFNAMTKQGELLVAGSEIKKDSTDIIYMKDMKCIPCEEKDARTIFRATKAKIIPNDKIVTGPMYLEIAGVATPLGLPFGFFPNTKKQHNGILLPTYGRSEEQGYFLRQGGYYWGINDMTDMTIKGDFYTNGSWAVNVNNNYRVLYKSNGSTYLSYSRFNFGDRDIPKQFNQKAAYEIRWIHNQDNRNNPNLRFGANVNYVSNQSINRFSSGNTAGFLQNNFFSRVNYTQNYKNSSLGVNASHNQNSQTGKMTITFPELTYNINRFFPFKRKNAIKQNVFDKIGISYLVQFNNSLIGKDSTIFKGSLMDSLRYGIKQSLPINTNFNLFKYITVTPGINLSSVAYMQSTNKTFILDSLVTDTSVKYTGKVASKIKKGPVAAYEASFTTGMSTKLFFDFAFNKGKVKQIRYLLIPTLGYTYRPDFGENKFGYWKSVQTSTTGLVSGYSIFENGVFGGPSRGKQNALSIYLNNNLEAKVKQQTDTGITFKKISILQNIGINTAYNFAADSFKMDVISITGRTVLFKNINLNASSTFDPYTYNHQKNRRTNRFMINESGKPARFTQAQLSVNTELSADKLESARKLNRPPNITNEAERGAQTQGNAAGQAWSISLGYNLTLTNSDDTKIQPSHALTTLFNLRPTKFWKLGITTGYDFNNQKASYTTFNINRDLKCWEANITWVPFGANKSYLFTINLKTAMLREFKIPRQRNWYDNL